MKIIGASCYMVPVDFAAVGLRRSRLAAHQVIHRAAARLIQGDEKDRLAIEIPFGVLYQRFHGGVRSGTAMPTQTQGTQRQPWRQATCGCPKGPKYRLGRPEP